jgi:hypothetical protein
MSSRPTYVDVEEIRTTASEKLLAVVLGAFLLIAGLWTYGRLDDWARAAFEPSISASDRAAVGARLAAENRAGRAAAAATAAREELVLAREAYRTALDANQPADGLRRAYESRQRDYEAARAAARAARAAASAVRAEATAAAERMAREEDRVRDREALLGFVLRLTFVAAFLGGGLQLLGRLRRVGSRWFPLAFSVVGAATLLAFVMGGDYVTDYVDPLDVGPLLLSLVGIVLTLFGFAALQRYLARRIPARRVRKGDCPFCGYPVGAGAHCEGCGREVVAPCARCASPRRVGTLHCRACGEA